MTTTGGVLDAVVAGARGVRRLPGHSAASVYLVTLDDHSWFVRKAANKAGDSGRLYEQCRRQQAFLCHDAPVGTPRVTGEGWVDGRYWFDMEFVVGRDGASYLRTGSYADVVGFADQLCDYVVFASEQGPLAGGSHGLGPALGDKLAELVARVPEAGILPSFDRSDFDRLPLTLCHGDLTLENMVVGRDGRVRLLDFLPSALDHTWFDVAKLHQDLEGGWYLRRGERITQCATTYLGQRVVDACEKVWSGYRAVHDFLVALAFFRIVPYAQTAEDRAFALRRARHFADRAT